MTHYESWLTIYVLFLHFAADFIFQSDAIARAKSKSWLALSAHIGIYSGVLAVGMLLWGPIFAGAWHVDFLGEWIDFALKWSALNGAIHFCVDAVTSRINSRLYAQGRTHAFFVGIGADQFIHAASIIGTLWIVSWVPK